MVPVDERVEVVKLGKLVTIELRPGVGVKLTEEKARSLGLLPRKAKKRSANKKRESSKSKLSGEDRIEKADGGKAGS
jgi:hypothetical protein